MPYQREPGLDICVEWSVMIFSDTSFGINFFRLYNMKMYYLEHGRNVNCTKYLAGHISIGLLSIVVVYHGHFPIYD